MKNFLFTPPLTGRYLLNVENNIVYLTLLYIVCTLHSIIHFVSISAYVHTFYLLLEYFGVVCVIVFLLGLNKYLRVILGTIILLVKTLYEEVNIFVYCKYEDFINGDIFQTILNTNINEVTEFIDSFVPLPLFLLALVMPVLFIVVSLISYGKITLSDLFRKIFIFLFLFSIIAIIHNPRVLVDQWQDLYRPFKFDEHVDLSKHRVYPSMLEKSKTHPSFIVVILGESAAKRHYSLYGYEKETTPRMQQLRDSGNLYVFENVVSPENITTQSFKYILNTCIKGDKNKWYDCPNIIDVMCGNGYRTRWISNQNRTGVTENISSAFSVLCDEEFFHVNDELHYDDFVLKYLDKKDKTLTLVHLMGQHPSFKSRYPNEYDVFKENDYLRYKEHQRKVRAEYDNATLYNDYIVSEICRFYSEKDAIVFYLPDHGLDIFDVDDDYYAHGRPKIPASAKIGKEIPFVIYITDKYKLLHPDEVGKIKTSVSNEFRTDSFIFGFLDILGYVFADNDDVQKNSFFNRAKVLK